MAKKQKPVLSGKSSAKNEPNRSTRSAATKASPPRDRKASARQQVPVSGRPSSAHGATKSDHRQRPDTLIERVRQEKARSTTQPTLAESEAVGLVLSTPGLLDELREQAFVALAVSVERKMAELGHRLTRFEAANVAWRILDR